MGLKAVRLLSETIIVFITIIMVGVSFYASQARLFNPQNYAFISLLSLFVIVILGINLFLTFYWASKLKAWFFVSTATILLFIPYFTTMVQIPFKDPHPLEDRDLCIVTYNVNSFNYHHDYNTTLQNIAFAIGEKDPDIICFQEFWSSNDSILNSISKLIGMPYYVLGKNGKGVKDLALFSKYPIEKTEFQVYKDTHNGSMYCDLNFKGRLIRIVNCHLQTTNLNQKRGEIRKLKQITEPRVFSQALQNIYSTLSDNTTRRAEQALAVNKIVKATKIPIIVCGDLNETPSSFVYNQVKENLKDGFKEAGRGFGGTYKSFFRILRVDYIFHSSAFECVNYISDNIDYSDHNPVFGFYKFK